MKAFKINYMKWRYFKQGVFFTLVRASALIITLALGMNLAFNLIADYVSHKFRQIGSGTL